MYQIEIATPMGSLLSQPEKLEDIETFLSALTSASDVTVTLEDKSLVFMTKAMIDSSVFFVKPVNS